MEKISGTRPGFLGTMLIVAHKRIPSFQQVVLAARHAPAKLGRKATNLSEEERIGLALACFAGTGLRAAYLLPSAGEEKELTTFQRVEPFVLGGGIATGAALLLPKQKEIVVSAFIIGVSIVLFSARDR